MSASHGRHAVVAKSAKGEIAVLRPQAEGADGALEARKLGGFAHDEN